MSDREAIAIRPAAVADVDTVRALFTEYARSLSFDLCFQNFDRELAELRPSATFLVATHDPLRLAPLASGALELV